MPGIDRKALVHRHNPVLTDICTASPLSVGNGEFCFTMDITGMQSLYGHYEQNKMPLCAMAQWGWHTKPVSADRYSYDLKDLTQTEYDFNGRKVTYPARPKPGEEDIYRWLRENPHRLDLARVGLLLDGQEISPDRLSAIRQELDLWTGTVTSRFSLDGVPAEVKTACLPGEDCLVFSVSSALLDSDRLSVLIDFPYGTPDISGADFSRRDAHQTDVSSVGPSLRFERTVDRDRYSCTLSSADDWDFSSDCGADRKPVPHRFILQPKVSQGDAHSFSFSLTFSPETGDGPDPLPEDTAGQTLSPVNENEKLPTVSSQPAEALSTCTLFAETASHWQSFWETTGAIDLQESTDPRAEELERRIVLSQYLLAVQCCGSLPPQETGLTCNSWHGKFHLEMTFWHEAWLPLWGRSDLLEKILPWYQEILPGSEERAAGNDYRGARWPKMVGPEGRESPSSINPLIIWQQPHIIHMLELCRREIAGKQPEQEAAFLRTWYPLIKETADYLADYAVKNEEGYYELLAPIIPVQECYPPETVRNPVFEVEYWVFGLKLAIAWAEKLYGPGKGLKEGEPGAEKWREVSEHMSRCPVDENGLYQAHANCTETYGKYAVDHPSFLMAFGLLDTGRIDPAAMERSLRKALETYDEGSLWGWDFAVMAMTAVRLGKPSLALDLLLKDTMKNCYEKSGNNRQVSRDDLPLYLPGNGSLLLAAAMMCAGYDGCRKDTPGFPDDGSWKVRYEGIRPLL